MNKKPKSLTLGRDTFLSRNVYFIWFNRALIFPNYICFESVRFRSQLFSKSHLRQYYVPGKSRFVPGPVYDPLFSGIPFVFVVRPLPSERCFRVTPISDDDAIVPRRQRSRGVRGFDAPNSHPPLESCTSPPTVAARPGSSYRLLPHPMATRRTDGPVGGTGKRWGAAGGYEAAREGDLWAA